MSFSAENTLLVPMGLRAMVMPAQDQNNGQGWDTRQMDYAKINSYQSPVPPVFGAGRQTGTGTPPQTGVHLYWTLPRTLTRALTQEEVDTATAAGAPPAQGVTPFPMVPNRWMVLRLQQNEGGPPTVAAWVINADEMDNSNGQSAYVNPFEVDRDKVVNPQNIGVARSLQDWVTQAQGAGFSNLPPQPFLTATGPGTGTFSAYTPGAGNVFSFCDPLDADGGTIDSATLSYAVFGWFAEAGSDPINPANPLNANGVGWTPVDAAALPEGAAPKAEGLSWVARLGWVAALGNGDAPEHTLVQALLQNVIWNRNAPLPEPAEFQDFTSTSQNVRVALANSSAEGVSAMAYDAMVQNGQSEVEAARHALELEALQYRALRYLDEPAGRHALADRIKRAAYSQEAGGYVWEVLGTGEDDTPPPPLTPRQANTLATLNQQQNALDQARDVLYTMQMRLFDLWWQQQAIPQATTPSGQPFQTQFINAAVQLAVPAHESLSPPVAAYQEQVAAQAARVAELEAALPPTDAAENGEAIETYAATFLDTDTQRLVPVPRPGFFAPSDPVVVVAGAGRLSKQQPQVVPCTRASTLSGAASNAAAAAVLPEAALGLQARLAAGGPSDDLEEDTWEQPWAPLYLDWEIKYNYVYKPGHAPGNIALTKQGHYAADQDAWAFDGRDYRWQGGAYGEDGGPLQKTYAITYSGRTFFSPHAKHTFARQLRQLAEENGVTLSDDAADKVADWSLVSQSTSGLTQFLSMRDTEANAGPGAAIAANVPPWLQGVPAPDLNPTPYLQDDQTGTPYFFPMRAGFISFSGLQLTDSFGRTMNLMSANNGSVQNDPLLLPILPPALTPPASAKVSDKGMAVMPPRLVQPSRLAFRMIDAEDDAAETSLTADGNPICGWLLPNHADLSLAVYDQDGQALGALQPFLVGNGTSVLQWVPAPGGDSAPGNPGTTPDIANTQLSDLVNGILNADDPSAAMKDLMTTLDQASWTLDPGEDRPRNGLAALMGHPVAVVRANIQLQLKGLPLINQSYEQIFVPPQTDVLRANSGGVEELEFEVQLGARALRRDGIAGYYLGSDYSQLCAVHKPREASSGYILQQGGSGTTGAPWPALSPVATPDTSDGTMNADGSLYLTLLVDPRGDLHATSGLLPRVRLTLPEAPVARALSQMALSVQVGPLLLNPGPVRMPLPPAGNGEWSWLRATGTAAGDWRTDPVLNSDGNATPMARAPALHDGWLVLSRKTVPVKTPTET